MISELYIEAYRGIRNLDLKDLGKINILAGANNVGKTSILEVIRSLEAPNDLMKWRKISRREEIDVITNAYDAIKALFPINVGSENRRIHYYGKSNEKDFDVEIIARIYETIITRREKSNIQEDYFINREFETAVMDLQYNINGKLQGNSKIVSIENSGSIDIYNDSIVKIEENIVYVSPVQHTQNKFFLDAFMVNPELYEQFINLMKQFDSGFISINAVGEEKTIGRNYVVLSKNHKEGLLLNSYGDGMKKAMLLLSAVIKAKDGILLLDEFETSIHISAMKDVFHWIMETAQQLNVQIFMTSHSIEAIETVLKCCPSLQKDIRMVTLVNVNDELKVRNVDGEKAVQLLDEYGLELR